MMRIYDILRKFHHYLIAIALIIIGATSYINLHRLNHLEETHDVMEAMILASKQKSQDAMVEQRVFAEHNIEQDRRMDEISNNFREEFRVHVAYDRTVERRLSILEKEVMRFKQ